MYRRWTCQQQVTHDGQCSSALFARCLLGSPASHLRSRKLRARPPSSLGRYCARSRSRIWISRATTTQSRDIATEIGPSITRHKVLAIERAAPSADSIGHYCCPPSTAVPPRALRAPWPISIQVSWACMQRVGAWCVCASHARDGARLRSHFSPRATRARGRPSCPPLSRCFSTTVAP